MQYDVFISYSRKDYVDDKKNIIPNNVVSKIKESLSDAGITYWFDEEGINYGNNFVEKIVTHIEQAHVFLFLSTENANKSSWTCKEIASADELGKYIIPVRIDNSPYNHKVLFRIADLSYIDYAPNPEKGLKDLVHSIKIHLTRIQEEKQRKIEEEKEQKNRELAKKKKEDEQKKKLQAQLIANITLTCSNLNNQEEKLEIDRKKLLLQADDITNEEQRITIKQQIAEGGCIHQKYKNEPKITNEDWANKEKEITKLRSERDKAQKLVTELGAKIKSINLEVARCSQKQRKTNWIYCILILAFIMICGIIFIKKNNTISYLQGKCLDYEDSIEELDYTIDNIKNNYAPLIITGIDVKNGGEEYGQNIVSINTTYLYLRIKYIGLLSGKVTLNVKWYKPDGSLSRGTSSPLNCSYEETYEIESGNGTLTLLGWGNETKGHWKSGMYRVEIWYKENILCSKSIEIY